MRTCLTVLLLLLALGTLSGQSFYSPAASPLGDPLIPSGEESRYIKRVGTSVSYSRVRIDVLADESAYSIQNFESSVTTALVVNRTDLVPIRKEETIQSASMEFTEMVSIAKAPQLGRDDVLVTALGDLPQLLRGYPFSNPRTLHSHTLSRENINVDEGESETRFGIQIEFRGRETISVNEVEHETYKLELVFHLPGIASIFSGVIPKTFFWYEIDRPHQLLRYQGPENFNLGAEQTTFVTELLNSRIAPPK